MLSYIFRISIKVKNMKYMEHLHAIYLRIIRIQYNQYYVSRLEMNLHVQLCIEHYKNKIYGNINYYSIYARLNSLWYWMLLDNLCIHFLCSAKIGVDFAE